MGLVLSKMSIISQGSSDLTRLNEDASYLCGSSDDLYLLVIDGVSVRLRTVTFDHFIRLHGENATAASYAAQSTRETITSAIASSMRSSIKPSPMSLLLAANATLQRQVEEVFGGITSDAILRVEPHLDILREDPRLIRLLLPACVATIVHVNLAISMLEFAHVGDTALFVKYTDGSISQITSDNMASHDRAALSKAIRKQQADANLHIIDLLSDEEIHFHNHHNGLFHNFVDEAGKTDPSVGVGAINGLPELVDYVQQGTLTLNNVSSLLVCSDGFIWPSIWNESETERVDRLQQMWQVITQESIGHYVKRLRATEAQDHQLDMYPRFKIHDDATGIYVEVEHE